MKIIHLTQGYESLISDEDYDYVYNKNYHSHFSNGGLIYAARCIKINKKTIIIYLHHEIVERMGLIVPYGKIIDHKNQNTLDNQRFNFRITTLSINAHNSKLHSNNRSGIKGVDYNEKRRKWQARIGVNKRTIWLGFFDRFEDAEKARLQAEIKYAKEIGN